jgi:hypothetical protein
MPDDPKGDDFGLPLGMRSQVQRASGSLTKQIKVLNRKLKGGKDSEKRKVDRALETLARVVLDDMVRLDLHIASLKGKLRLK